MPDFGGVIRYEQEVELRPEEIQHAVLEISDAGEAVQVFVNGADCGIQIIPPYRYEIDKLLITGKNRIVIEVATTLERKYHQRENRRTGNRRIRSVYAEKYIYITKNNKSRRNKKMKLFPENFLWGAAVLPSR